MRTEKVYTYCTVATRCDEFNLRRNCRLSLLVADSIMNAAVVVSKDSWSIALFVYGSAVALILMSRLVAFPVD